MYPKFKQREIYEMLSEKMNNVEAATVRVFERAGIEAVNEAVLSGSYRNRTGNLRNSIGYIVAIDGEVVSELFKNDYGSQYAKKILLDYPKGIVLIVVAGMNYGVYVEARGYNVLTSAEKLAERRIPILINKTVNADNI